MKICKSADIDKLEITIFSRVSEIECGERALTLKSRAKTGLSALTERENAGTLKEKNESQVGYRRDGGICMLKRARGTRIRMMGQADDWSSLSWYSVDSSLSAYI